MHYSGCLHHFFFPLWYFTRVHQQTHMVVRRGFFPLGTCCTTIACICLVKFCPCLASLDSPIRIPMLNAAKQRFFSLKIALTSPRLPLPLNFICICSIHNYTLRMQKKDSENHCNPLAIPTADWSKLIPLHAGSQLSQLLNGSCLYQINRNLMLLLGSQVWKKLQKIGSTNNTTRGYILGFGHLKNSPAIIMIFHNHGHNY